MFDDLLGGLLTVLRPEYLTYSFLGVLLGQIVGVMPGIGALTAIALLLPATFYLDPTASLIMLAGIYYGSNYGGAIASILLRLPGTPASVVTCIEGYPLAQAGRAGLALFTTAVASFVGSILGTILLILAAIPMAAFALRFGAPEYAALVLLGLLAASLISSGSQLRGVAMVLLGLILGLVGSDVNTGFYRFVVVPTLADGISLIAVAMGLFGVAEIIRNIGQPRPAGLLQPVTLRSMLPRREELREIVPPILRGSGVGSAFGALPGTGAAIASFMAYAVEKRVARRPGTFGKGALPGLAAPEAANNAASQTGFIPTLSLGIPGDALMALMLGALIINGIVPGPNLVSDQPGLFWGVIASFLVGNLILLIINLPLIQLWVRLISIPYWIIYPAVLLFVCVGVYSFRNSVTDVYTTILFGFIGYAMILMRFEAAPLLLGFILGPMLEENFRRAMLIHRGDLTIFVTRPISAVLVACCVALIAYALWSSLKKR